MKEYSMIADVSRAIIGIMQKALVPDIVASNDSIGLCSPADRNDVLLGLFLYDIIESDELRRSTTRTNTISDRLNYPPIYLNLYYMITPYFTGNVKYRMLSEQEALGRLIQQFHDYPLIPADEVAQENENVIDLRVEMLRLDNEEKSKIWTFPNEPYRTSLFYKVSPVVINSSRYRDITRVSEADIHVNSMNKR